MRKLELYEKVLLLALTSLFLFYGIQYLRGKNKEQRFNFDNGCGMMFTDCLGSGINKQDCLKYLKSIGCTPQE